MTISSVTRSPRASTSLTFSPSSEPEAIAARSMSPVESWTMPFSSSSRTACVPLPLSMMAMFAFCRSFAADSTSSGSPASIPAA